MARYIDADALKQRLLVGSELDPEPCKGFRSALLAMVDTQEDADVIERNDLISILHMIVADLNKEMDECLEREEFTSRFYLKAKRSMVEHLISIFEEADDGSLL